MMLPLRRDDVMVSSLLCWTLRMRRLQWSGNAAELQAALNSIARHSLSTQRARVAMGIRIASGMEYPSILIDIEHNR